MTKLICCFLFFAVTRNVFSSEPSTVSVKDLVGIEIGMKAQDLVTHFEPQSPTFRVVRDIDDMFKPNAGELHTRQYGELLLGMDPHAMLRPEIHLLNLCNVGYVPKIGLAQYSFSDHTIVSVSAIAVGPYGGRFLSRIDAESKAEELAQKMQKTVGRIVNYDGDSYSVTFKDKRGKYITFTMGIQKSFKQGEWSVVYSFSENCSKELSKSADNNLDQKNAFAKAAGKLVIITAGNMAGSGFVLRTDAKTYLYTNAHVARGGTPFKACLLTGKELKLGPFQFATNRDLVRFEVTDGCQAFELKSKAIVMHEPIVVLGNSDGGGVATLLQGKICGIGPKFIEVTAEFVHGNSGSPVIDLDGYVCGVATYAIDMKDNSDWVKSGTRFNGVRRFAVRIEGAKWKTVDWNLYQSVVRNSDDN